MSASFYFYDLETSGLNPRDDRVMQFAGQRTDPELNPLGDPDNFLISLADDTLPSPAAILVTGITPQATRADGLSEPEFCRFVTEQLATPGTTILGFNSVRFDDEFMRATLWRNFYDPYEWQWQDGRSRWDLLDVVRLTRALRPEGINWPVTPEGKPTNRLELITKENHISHAHAHDALADVMALIEVAKLIRQHQSQLFDYLYQLRDKRRVQQLVNLDRPAPFVYASGRYPSEFGHTTVAYPVAPARNGNVLVFDLRVSPRAFWAELQQPDPERPLLARLRPTLKPLAYNRCPAVAPLGVLEKSDGWQKLQLTPELVKQHLAELQSVPELIKLAAETFAAPPSRSSSANPATPSASGTATSPAAPADAQSHPARPAPPTPDADAALYDGFLNDHDRRLCQVVRNNGREELADFHPDFNDERLPDLLLHYKARNYPDALSADETARWEQYRTQRLNAQAPQFLADLQAAQQDLLAHPSNRNEYLLEELSLWFQSLQA